MHKSYTKQAEEVLRVAKKLARQMGQSLYRNRTSSCSAKASIYRCGRTRVLAANGIEEDEIKKVVAELVSPIGERDGKEKPEESPRLSYILESSEVQAAKFRSEKIGTEHMLFSMILDGECVAAKILATLNVNLQKLAGDILEASGVDPELLKEVQDGQGNQDTLEQYSTDLTRQAERRKVRSGGRT